jgi:hypothetical protein
MSTFKYFLINIIKMLKINIYETIIDNICDERGNLKFFISVSDFLEQLGFFNFCEIFLESRDIIQN